MINPSTMNISELAARLSEMTIFELRNEWRRHHRMSPPMRLSRDILLRGILYQHQVKAYGGLPKGMQRKLYQGEESLDLGAKSKTVETRALKAGTRLVREWRGVTHMVLVLDEGFEWRDQRYASLSIIAREITGAHWSGPRFFGLRSMKSSRG